MSLGVGTRSVSSWPEWDPGGHTLGAIPWGEVESPGLNLAENSRQKHARTSV